MIDSPSLTASALLWNYNRGELSAAGLPLGPMGGFFTTLLRRCPVPCTLHLNALPPQRSENFFKVISKIAPKSAWSLAEGGYFAPSLIQVLVDIQCRTSEKSGKLSSIKYLPINGKRRTEHNMTLVHFSTFYSIRFFLGKEGAGANYSGCRILANFQRFMTRVARDIISWTADLHWICNENLRLMMWLMFARVQTDGYSYVVKIEKEWVGRLICSCMISSIVINSM